MRLTALVYAAGLLWPASGIAQEFPALFQVRSFLKHALLCKRLPVMDMLKVRLTPFSQCLAQCTSNNMPCFVYRRGPLRGSLRT